jgi:hypothetical protein
MGLVGARACAPTRVLGRMMRDHRDNVIRAGANLVEVFVGPEESGALQGTRLTTRSLASSMPWASRVPYRRPSGSVRSRISNSCARVHGGPGISPRDSQRRTTGGDALHAAAAWRPEAIASGRLTPGTLSGLNGSLWRELILRLSPIGQIGLNPPRSPWTSGRKICGDNKSEPLRAPTMCCKQHNLKGFCGLPGIQRQNICSVGDLGPWESWDLWTTQCREIQIGS